jgi:hypothetical protein
VVVADEHLAGSAEHPSVLGNDRHRGLIHAGLQVRQSALDDHLVASRHDAANERLMPGRLFVPRLHPAHPVEPVLLRAPGQLGIDSVRIGRGVGIVAIEPDAGEPTLPVAQFARGCIDMRGHPGVRQRSPQTEIVASFGAVPVPIELDLVAFLHGDVLRGDRFPLLPVAEHLPRDEHLACPCRDVQHLHGLAIGGRVAMPVPVAALHVDPDHPVLWAEPLQHGRRFGSAVTPIIEVSRIPPR